MSVLTCVIHLDTVVNTNFNASVEISIDAFAIHNFAKTLIRYSYLMTSPLIVIFKNSIKKQIPQIIVAVGLMIPLILFAIAAQFPEKTFAVNAV